VRIRGEPDEHRRLFTDRLDDRAELAECVPLEVKATELETCDSGSARGPRSQGSWSPRDNSKRRRRQSASREDRAETLAESGQFQVIDPAVAVEVQVVPVIRLPQHRPERGTEYGEVGVVDRPVAVDVAVEAEEGHHTVP